MNVSFTDFHMPMQIARATLRRHRWCAMAAVLAACTPTQPSSRPVRAPIDASRIGLFDGQGRATLLAQCSRNSVTADAVFRPTLEQVADAEPAVVAALGRPENAVEPEAEVAGLADLRRRWRVEATGVLRHGRRSVYLNYVRREGPSWDSDHGHDPNTPTMICDVGPSLFGANVDLTSGAVIDLSFNGPPPSRSDGPE